MFAVIRILIGLVLLASGLEKVTSPYQNFQYAIEAYHLLPGWGEEWTARIFPWLELFAGLFAVLGLWTQAALKAVLLFFAVFILVVGQALLRGLPLDQCGCFGQALHVPPQVIIVFDSACLLLTALLLRNPRKSQQLSLDKYFEK